MRLNPKHQRQMANLSIKTSFRSGLEARIAEQISEAGLAVEYETDRIGFHWPERLARYTPDFKLPKAGGGYFFIEVKGRWETADRQKMLLVRQQNPDLDIRMLFQRASNKLYKGSPTTYAEWCDQHGFQWCEKAIPEDWLETESDDATEQQSEPEDRISPSQDRFDHGT